MAWVVMALVCLTYTNETIGYANRLTYLLTDCFELVASNIGMLTKAIYGEPESDLEKEGKKPIYQFGTAFGLGREDSNLVDPASSICLTWRLSHACLSISYILRNCEWLIKTVIIYLMIILHG